MPGEHLTAERHRALVARAAASPRWLDIDDAGMRAHYNRSGFLVRHRLPDHPLFTLEALSALCRRMPAGAVKHRVGQVPIDAHFDSSLSRFQRGLTLEDAIGHLEEKRAYLAVYNPERDPEYRPVIEGLLGELGLATGRLGLEQRFNWYSTYVFISAHDAVTPYHMDREMNFLLQVRGRKTVQLWDPDDDEVMSPAQRDRLFSEDPDARPTWRDGLERKARTFELAPGLGVHHPFIAPHLVTTGPNVSISLAITFRTPRSDVWTDAHVYNRRMQAIGLGLGRLPVGRHPVVDQAKAGVMRLARHLKATLHPSAQPDATPTAG